LICPPSPGHATAPDFVADDPALSFFHRPVMVKVRVMIS
jgi:hypothetical protein